MFESHILHALSHAGPISTTAPKSSGSRFENEEPARRYCDMRPVNPRRRRPFGSQHVRSWQLCRSEALANAVLSCVLAFLTKPLMESTSSRNAWRATRGKPRRFRRAVSTSRRFQIHVRCVLVQLPQPCEPILTLPETRDNRFVCACRRKMRCKSTLTPWTRSLASCVGFAMIWKRITQRRTRSSRRPT